MPVILFKLRNVPEDEADEIRELLEKNHFDFYETPAGRWGISAGGFWLRDESQLENGKRLIEQYQKERQVRARQEYQRMKEAGELDTFFKRIKQHPVAVLMLILMIAFVLYFSVSPFLDIGKK